MFPAKTNSEPLVALVLLRVFTPAAVRAAALDGEVLVGGLGAALDLPPARQVQAITNATQRVSRPPTPVPVRRTPETRLETALGKYRRPGLIVQNRYRISNDTWFCAYPANSVSESLSR